MIQHFFDPETGLLQLDEWVAKRETFQKIMHDEVVTDEEVSQQATLVISLLKQLDEMLRNEDKQLVMETMAELAVLQVVTQVQQLLEIKNI